MGHIDVDYYISEDNISINQIRKVLLLSYDMEVYPDSLKLSYRGYDCCLELSSGKNLCLMYGGGGDLVYLHDVDSVTFEEREDYIYLIYQREGKEYEFNIGQAQGISISYVSNCIPATSNNNNSE